MSIKKVYVELKNKKYKIGEVISIDAGNHCQFSTSLYLEFFDIFLTKFEKVNDFYNKAVFEVNDILEKKTYRFVYTDDIEQNENDEIILSPVLF